MNIVTGRPPNFEEIAAVFPAARKLGTIFTYGDTVYVSDGAALSKPLVEHEAVHSKRQNLMGRDNWWAQYLISAQFRLEEELPAHIAEYGAACLGKTRNQRRAVARVIAMRLSGPLYGGLLKLHDAKMMILRGAGVEAKDV